MAGLRWIKTSLNVMLLLQFTAVPGQQPVVVRDGSEATFSCGNIRNHQVKCDGTNWTFSDSISFSEELVVLGHNQLHRVRVTENCSLVLKKVSHEHIGLYICRQVDTSGRPQDTRFSLSVVTMTEHDDGENMILNCSVSTYEDCKGKVLWLYKGSPVDTANRDLKTSQSGCSATVSFSNSNFTSNSLDNFKCEVTSSSSENKHQFTFSPRSSGGRWWSIIAMTSAAVILTALVLFVISRKRRRNKRRKTAEDKAEDNVSYVSITLPPSSNNTVHGGDDTMIYSMASAPSDNPPHVYATIN